MSVNPIGLIQSGPGDALGTGLGGCPRSTGRVLAPDRCGGPSPPYL